MIGNIKHEHVNQDDIDRIIDECGCGPSLARDLLVLAGGDVDMVCNVSSRFEFGIESVKNAIIDARFSRLEEER